MKKKTVILKVDHIIGHFMPDYGTRTVENPGEERRTPGVAKTKPNKDRTEEDKTAEAERNWLRNMAFLSGVWVAMPRGFSLDSKAEKLYLDCWQFGKTQPFDTNAKRRRVVKQGRDILKIVKEVQWLEKKRRRP